MGYRVDTVPWPLRPLYLAVTGTLGLLFYLYYAVCRFTSRVSSKRWSALRMGGLA